MVLSYLNLWLGRFFFIEFFDIKMVIFIKFLKGIEEWFVLKKVLI